MEKMKQKVILGIGASKDKLDIWIIPINKHIVIKNQPRAIGQWLKKVVVSYDIDDLALEPTGGYEKELVRQLINKGISTYFIHSNKLKHFQKAQGPLVKMDKIAASELAKFLSQYRDQEKPIGKEYITNKVHSEISHRIQQLKKQIRTEENRLEKYLFDKQVTQSIKHYIKFLTTELAKINQHADNTILQDDDIKQKYECIQTFVGVGNVTAQTFKKSGDIAPNRCRTYQ